MSLVLLFNHWRGGVRTGRMLSVRKARRLAVTARKMLEEKRARRREWEEPVRAFLSEVRREVKRVPEKHPERPIEITPYMVAALAEAFAPKREEISLARLEQLLAEASAAENRRMLAQQQRDLALELLWLVTESQRQEDEDLWLMAMTAAAI